MHQTNTFAINHWTLSSFPSKLQSRSNVLFKIIHCCSFGGNLLTAENYNHLMISNKVSKQFWLKNVIIFRTINRKKNWRLTCRVLRRASNTRCPIVWRELITLYTEACLLREVYCRRKWQLCWVSAMRSTRKSLWFCQCRSSPDVRDSRQVPGNFSLPVQEEPAVRVTRVFCITTMRKSFRIKFYRAYNNSTEPFVNHFPVDSR